MRGRRTALLAFTFALAVAALVSGCGGRTVIVSKQAAASATGDQRFYGQIKSIVRSGDHYWLRFDPALFLSGVTANVAAAEDQHISCKPSACPPVPNDNYRLDEGHRLLTFILPADVSGTVLTRKGRGPFPATKITAAQLAELVAGTSSLKLFEPLSSGVWILVHIDKVQTFAQQYVP